MANEKLKIVIETNGEGRALFNSVGLGKMIIVIGDSLYTCDKNNCVTEIGRLLTKNGPVHIEEHHSKQLVILDKKHIYLYDYRTNTFAEISLFQ